MQLIREDPVLVWLLFLGLLIIIVPAASVLWGKRPGRTAGDAENSPPRATGSTRFGNRAEFIILFWGLVLLVAAILWIRRAFFA